MGSPTLSTYMLSSTSFSSVISRSSKFPLQNPITNTPLLKPTTHHLIRPLVPKTRAAPGETDQTTTTPLLIQEEEQPNKKGLERGKYFPITAVQRFDAAAKRIENGVFLGPLGWLTFEGRFSWKKRILAFIFERIRIKVGPFNPFDINFKGRDESEPSSKNPFFIWFYVDEEIAVARGRSGGTAFWCRCQRITSF
ncbi:hypothetical protein RJ639_021218 [Escallonia herrerae]|uniref:Uncharacterized protein n=1 Tax=Escallonia herrerae TaxID=1293975 RepID=A0AA88V5H2_9ASTE|nr:hypothetical protein RJ639_021218 [Escallonia herrerae]